MFISGYVDNVEDISKELEFDAVFLRKPFTPEELLEAVEKLKL